MILLSTLILFGCGKIIAETHMAKATLAYEIRDYSKAMEEYTQAGLKNPKLHQAFAGKAKIYMARREYKKSEDEYSMAILADSTNDKYFVARAESRMMQKKYKDTIKDLDKALALIKMKKDDKDRKKDEFSESNISIEERSSEIYHLKALAYRKLESDENYFSDMNSAINILQKLHDETDSNLEKNKYKKIMKNYQYEMKLYRIDKGMIN